MTLSVIPAQAGIQWRYRLIFFIRSGTDLKKPWRVATILAMSPLDSGLRRNDREGREALLVNATFLIC